MKPAAFMPPPDLQLSVFDITDFGDVAIWEIGHRDVAAVSNRTLCGRGDFPPEAVTAAGLRLVPDPPPPRHENVVDWPDDKGARKLKAQALAETAVPHAVPQPAP